MSDQDRVVGWAVCGLLGAGLAPGGPVRAEIPPGLQPSEPIVCRGNQELEVRGRYIVTDGDGIEVGGNCELRLVDSHVEAGGVGVWAVNNGEVTIERSFVSGRRAGLRADNRAEIWFTDSTIRGGTVAWNLAEIHEGRGNDVSGRVVAGGAAPGSGDVSIRTGPGGVRVESGGETVVVGPGSVTVESGGERVEVTPDEVGVDDGTTIEVDPSGVRVTSGGEEVVVEEGYVRITDGRGVTEITGDWRTGGTIYSAADTERLLVELGAREEAGELELRMAGDVLFDFDSTAMRPEAIDELRKVAHLIRSRSRGIVYVTGHTDSVGSASYNLELSKERALTVMGWLNLNEDIPMRLMAGRGMGEQQPIAHNTRPDGSDDPEGRARNRRVEVRFAVE